MKKLLQILTLVPIINLSIAQNESKVLFLNKTEIEIELDGIIEYAWSSADSISDFFQFQLYHGKKHTKGQFPKS